MNNDQTINSKKKSNSPSDILINLLKKTGIKVNNPRALAIDKYFNIFILSDVIYVINSQTGELEVCTISIELISVSDMIIYNSKLYISSEDNLCIYVFAITYDNDGNPILTNSSKIETNKNTPYNLAIDETNNNLYYIGSSTTSKNFQILKFNNGTTSIVQQNLSFLPSGIAAYKNIIYYLFKEDLFSFNIDNKQINILKSFDANTNGKIKINNGNIYIADKNTNKIIKYNIESQDTTDLTELDPVLESLSSLAIDNIGNLYIGDLNKNIVSMIPASKT
jgi:outer membrane protein assembly factor BamB